MGAFIREMFRVGLYKRTQGRITRQMTFAAVVVILAFGLWRLSTLLVGLDPTIKAAPAMVECVVKDGKVGADGDMKLTGPAGTASIPVHAGDSLDALAEAIGKYRAATGVDAYVDKGKLVLKTVAKEAAATLRVVPPDGAMTVEGLGPDGVAKGCDSLNLGLHFLIPGVLLLLTIWVSYRAVNVPAFADFLIAVAAEMNKVSWSTWPELVRASLVVIFVIISLAVVLAGFDLFWKLFFSKVLHIL